MSKRKSKEDTYSYEGWLNSDSFLKRAFAIWGYGFIPPIIFVSVLFAIAIFFGIIFYLFSI